MAMSSVVSNATPPDYSGNWGDYSMYHNSSHERGFLHSAAFGTFICIWNFLTNAALVMIVCWRRPTRVQYVYSQVVNLAVSDLLFSLLVDSITVYYELEQWRLGEHVCKAWMILDVIIPFVSLIIIVLLNVDRLIFALRPSLYYRLFRWRSSRAFVLVLPWVLSLAVLTPLWLLTSVIEPYPEFCIYGVTNEAVVVSSMVSLFLPAIVITILTVIVLVTIIGGLPDELGHFTSATLHGLRVDKKIIKRRHRSIVTAMCLVNFSSLAMQLPFGAISLLQPHCTDEACTDTVQMMQALSWLRSACPGIRALFWFIISDIRHSCCCCCSGCDEYGNGIEQDQIEMTSANTANEQLINSSHVRNENSINEKG